METSLLISTRLFPSEKYLFTCVVCNIMYIPLLMVDHTLLALCFAPHFVVSSVTAKSCLLIFIILAIINRFIKELHLKACGRLSPTPPCYLVVTAL